MKTNYLLIDYENVQPKNLAALNGTKFKVMVFLGANQTKVPVEFAKALQALGTDAEYIQISGNGNNALDFHIAFMMGELSKADPNAYFHIISKDTGFDPLIEHAKTRKIHIQRSKDISEPEKLDAIIQNLSGRGSSRPRKLKTLKNTINSLFLKSLEESELTNLVQALSKRGHIVIEGENVSYKLPASS